MSKEPDAADNVLIGKEDIQRALTSSKFAATAPQEFGHALQLSPEQLSALLGGTSDLELSRSQYQTLVSSITALRKSGEKKDDKAGGAAKPDDGAGSLCGSTKSPKAGAVADGDKVASVSGKRKDVTEDDKGTTGVTEKVGKGTVTVRKDVKGDIGGTTYDHLFAISYQGKDAKDVHWLQFIHREIIGIHDDGAHPQTGSITTSGGTYQLTTGGDAAKNGTPGKVNYNTDTSSADPFYESGFAANRTADATTMFDLPSAADSRVQAAFAAGAKRVISRCHFDTFMVDTDHVVYKVNVDISYDFADAKAKPAPVTTVAGGAAAGLPATIAERFHDQFPAFNYLK